MIPCVMDEIKVGEGVLILKKGGKMAYFDQLERKYIWSEIGF